MSMGNFLFADQRCHWRFEGYLIGNRGKVAIEMIMYRRLLCWVLPLVALDLRHCEMLTR